MIQKMIFVLICLFPALLMGCQNETDQGPVNNSKSQTKDTEETSKEIEQKVFKQNEEAILLNEEGEEVFSLTINSVEVAPVLDEFYQEDIPADSEQTVIVTYTYKYISELPDMDDLRVSPGDDLIVYDGSGLASDFIDVGGDFPFDSDSPDIYPGRSAKTHKVFSLKNKSNVIQIDCGSVNFGMDNFNEKLTFEIPVEF